MLPTSRNFWWQHIPKSQHFSFCQEKLQHIQEKTCSHIRLLIRDQDRDWPNHRRSKSAESFVFTIENLRCEESSDCIHHWNMKREIWIFALWIELTSPSHKIPKVAVETNENRKSRIMIKIFISCYRVKSGPLSLRRGNSRLVMIMLHHDVVQNLIMRSFDDHFWNSL